MSLFGSDLAVHLLDQQTYDEEKYRQLQKLVRRYRKKIAKVRKRYELLFDELDMATLCIDTDMRDVSVYLIRVETMRLQYDLVLDLLKIERRFQGRLCKHGFEWSQTKIATISRVYHLYNKAMDIRTVALNYGLPVYSHHQKYH